jgi:DNA repair protein RadC
MVKNIIKNKIIAKPSDVLNFCHKIRNSKDKLCKVFYLDENKKLLSVKTLNLDNKLPSKNFVIKEILIPCFYISTKSIILVHNHPNGLALPQQTEINLTKKISNIGHFFGIALIDHLIITKDEYYSFHESGII